MVKIVGGLRMTVSCTQYAGYCAVCTPHRQWRVLPDKMTGRSTTPTRQEESFACLFLEAFSKIDKLAISTSNYIAVVQCMSIQLSD